MKHQSDVQNKAMLPMLKLLHNSQHHIREVRLSLQLLGSAPGCCLNNSFPVE